MQRLRHNFSYRSASEQMIVPCLLPTRNYCPPAHPTTTATIPLHTTYYYILHATCYILLLPLPLPLLLLLQTGSTECHCRHHCYYSFPCAALRFPGPMAVPTLALPTAWMGGWVDGWMNGWVGGGHQHSALRAGVIKKRTSEYTPKTAQSVLAVYLLLTTTILHTTYYLLPTTILHTTYYLPTTTILHTTYYYILHATCYILRLPLPSPLLLLPSPSSA